MSAIERERLNRLLTVITDVRTWLLFHDEVRNAPGAGYIEDRLFMALEDHNWLPKEKEGGG